MISGCAVYTIFLQIFQILHKKSEKAHRKVIKAPQVRLGFAKKAAKKLPRGRGKNRKRGKECEKRQKVRNTRKVYKFFVSFFLCCDIIDSA